MFSVLIHRTRTTTLSTLAEQCHQHDLSSTFKFNLPTITVSAIHLYSSSLRQREPIPQRSNRRREKILPTLGHDPVGQQRHRRVRVGRVHARHRARLKLSFQVSAVLADDGVEARHDGPLAKGEVDVVGLACQRAVHHPSGTPCEQLCSQKSKI